ncbi:cation diffusion facilitator family transporter [Maricaulis parjimensis]|uniref:cation diffusion facilitator family transporter n=1 Tax=Maricaulis parjimensis TaxID=144023 RepID=UPI00193AC3B8|nr:cation diffusion facilitator family transporter [Maricaulis parjimensis]
MPHDHVASPAGPGRLRPEQALKYTSRATAASVGVAATLALTKGIVWWMSGSVAILASAADSLLDLTASLAVYFSVRYAAEPADHEHRYGHGKAEAFAGIFQAILVAVSAALLIREGIDHIIEPLPLRASPWALGVMGLSILLTVGLLWVQTQAVKKTGSVAVEGDRAHYFTDLASNLVVIAGIIGSVMFGWLWLDAVAALGVAGWLGWTAWGVARGAGNQLMDRELPQSDREQIQAIAEDDPRIIDIHQLRTRAAGPLLHIQFHMALPPGIALRDAHAIQVDCERRLLKAYPAADIIIHADPHGEAERHGADFFRPDEE